MHKAFYGKYNGIFRACANSVYQASPWWGPGDEYIFYKCVLLILRPPTLIFNHFHDEKQDISLLWPNTTGQPSALTILYKYCTGGTEVP